MEHGPDNSQYLDCKLQFFSEFLITFCVPKKGHNVNHCFFRLFFSGEQQKISIMKIKPKQNMTTVQLIADNQTFSKL